MFPLVNRDVKNVEELIPLLLLIIPVTFKVENSLLYKNYLMLFVFFSAFSNHYRQLGTLMRLFQKGLLRIFHLSRCKMESKYSRGNLASAKIYISLLSITMTIKLPLFPRSSILFFPVCLSCRVKFK